MSSLRQWLHNTLGSDTRPLVWCAHNGHHFDAPILTLVVLMHKRLDLPWGPIAKLMALTTRRAQRLQLEMRQVGMGLRCCRAPRSLP